MMVMLANMLLEMVFASICGCIGVSFLINLLVVEAFKVLVVVEL